VGLLAIGGGGVQPMEALIRSGSGARLAGAAALLRDIAVVCVRMSLRAMGLDPVLVAATKRRRRDLLGGYVSRSGQRSQDSLRSGDVSVHRSALCLIPAEGCVASRTKQATDPSRRVVMINGHPLGLGKGTLAERAGMPLARLELYA